MKKAARAGGGSLSQDPKEKEYNEIMNMLEFPSPLHNEMLDGIDPYSWMNVGPSVVNCS